MQASAPEAQHVGLRTADQLAQYEIWDSYFMPSDNGADGGQLFADIEKTIPLFDQGAVRRACIFLHVGLGTAGPTAEKRIRANPDGVLEPLRRWPKLLLGAMRLNANDVPGSLAALDRYMKDGPILGVYFPSGPWGALRCTHP